MDGARVEGARLLYKQKLLRRWETVGLLQLVPRNMWGFPLLGVPQNGRFTMENLLPLMIWWYPHVWKLPCSMKCGVLGSLLGISTSPCTACDAARWFKQFADTVRKVLSSDGFLTLERNTRKDQNEAWNRTASLTNSTLICKSVGSRQWKRGYV